MKLIVDTNIVFSGILNSESNISKILVHSARQFQLYSPEFLKHEIHAHRLKLKKYLKLREPEIDELIELTTSRINFINENLKPEKHWKAAANLLASVDMDDTPFVALSSYLKATLWAGDKGLIRVLKNQNKAKVITTSELLEKIK
jgi:putative PIN family toxin of toxin-antitoxin system